MGVPLLLMLAGSAAQYGGARTQASVVAAQGRQERALADYQAGQVVASGQHAAQEEYRKAALVQSRAMALAASSGAGGNDVTNLLANIEAEGVYRAAVAMYETEAQASFMRASGRAAEAGALARAGAIKTAAKGQLVADAASFYSKYGGGGPSKGNAEPEVGSGLVSAETYTPAPVQHGPY